MPAQSRGEESVDRRGEATCRQGEPRVHGADGNWSFGAGSPEKVE